MSKGGGKPPAAPDYNQVARTQGEQNLAAIRTGADLNRVNQTNPYGSTTYTNNGGDKWTQTTSLSGDQQRILDSQEENQTAALAQARQRLLQISDKPAFTTAYSIPRGQTVATTQASPYEGDAGRQKVEDTLYSSASKRLDDQFGRESESERQRLINSGNMEGSEGFNNAMKDFTDRKQDAYGDARDRAILAGGQEQSRMLADALRRGDQSFEQGLANSNIQSTNRQNQINEQLMERSVPLQEFLQLYSGQASPGAGNPQIASVASPQAADYQGAAQAGYNAQSDLYNWNQNRNAQNTNSALNLAALAAMMYGS